MKQLELFKPPPLTLTPPRFWPAPVRPPLVCLNFVRNTCSRYYPDGKGRLLKDTYEFDEGRAWGSDRDTLDLVRKGKMA